VSDESGSIAAAERSASQVGVRELVAISTLPALWSGAQPVRIAESLAAALFTTAWPRAMLVVLTGDRGEPGASVAQTGRYRTDAALAERLAGQVLSWARGHDPDELLEVVGCAEERLTFSVRGIGHHAELGVIAAAFEPGVRPDAMQHLLLNIAATQAATAVQNTRLLRSLERTAAERERAAHLAEMRERRLNEVFDRAPAFMAVLRGPDFVFERSNAAFDELAGHRPLVGRAVLDAFPEVADTPFPALLREVARTGEPYAEREARVRLVRGGKLEERVLDFVYQPLREADGTISGVIVHGVDLTERVRAEDAAHRVRAESERQKRLYEAILNNTPDLAYIFDLDHRFTYANDVLLRMWGRTWDEAIGKNCLELGYEPWHAAMHDREIDQVAATKAPIRGEVPFTGTFGRRIHDYIFVPVIGEDGQVEAVAGTTRDVTDRVEMDDKIKKQAEALAEESRRKDEFLAMLSHELRNPMAAVRSAVHLLKASEKGAAPNPMRQKAREVIERQVGNLTKLVNDLLEVSRVISGRIRLTRQTVDLRETVRHATETVRSLMDQRRHAVSLSAGDDPLWASGDATRLEEVFINILTNAAKYTEEGGRIEIVCAAVGEDACEVRVRDNGIGVDDKLKPRIFDLFTQADRTLDRAQGGLGIGLSLAQRLVTLHGGTIDVESPPPGAAKGSEFRVRLPRAEPPASAPGAVRPEERCAPRSGRRVLLVDDNVDQATMLAGALQELSYSVQTAHSGPDGLKLAQQWRPDVVLLDIGLPGMDGYEVARRLRADPALRGARLLAITGYGRDADTAKSREAGFDAHLVKPCGVEQIEAAMARAARN